jgi:multiple sugar transport system permease protein
VSQSSTAGPAVTRTDLPASHYEPQALELRALSRADRLAPAVFLMPAVLVVLVTAIFPLIVSLYLSLTRFKLAAGGFQFKFIGLLNYEKLLFGSQQFQLLGQLQPVPPAGWAVAALVTAGAVWLLVRAARRGVTLLGLAGRLTIAVAVVAIALLFGATVFAGAELGSLPVTLIYVFVGVALQYFAGLCLALLCAMKLRGRSFFRVVFFLPMMITPVGIAYTFRMVTDTTKGPFAPIWQGLGLGDFAWAATAWGARAAVMIGDAWQWIPFMFIVLLAALEAQPREQVEAAWVDGADRWQVFRHITWPAILPVSVALVLIRIIEAFKIVDLPNVLTNGGPGIASESMTLHAFITWRTLDLGGSAAIAYLLLIIVSFFCIAFVGMTKGARQ